MEEKRKINIDGQDGTRSVYMITTVDRDMLEAAKDAGCHCDDCNVCINAEIRTCTSKITKAEAHAVAKSIAEENENLIVKLFRVEPIGTYAIPKNEAKFTPHK